MDDIRKVADLLYGPGEVMPGIEMSLEQALERVKTFTHFPEEPYCVVRNWIWIDLILPDRVREELKAAGQESVMLYADSVLYDSNRRFDVGNWVRTTPLISFSEGCCFRTRNTLYVLVGSGLRKRAELPTVVKIF